MRNIKYLFRNIYLLNVLLLGGAIFFAHYILMPMPRFNLQYRLSSIKKALQDKPEQSSGNQHIASISDYIPVADNNLFHPERKIPSEKTVAAQQPSLPQPELVLYGTLITEDKSLAYLEDLKSPRNTLGRGKRQTVMRVGDSLGGFVLKQIDTNKITMARGEEIMQVYIHDMQRKRMREQAITVSPPAPRQPPTKPQQQPPANPSRTTTPLAPYYNPRQGMPKEAFEQPIFDLFDKNIKNP
jgi:hypothetical protein